uniref:RNA helicase n=1 Tax=Thermosporothrix sp. COM3 TaxID=2490863 RepID=A0A455SVG7_9CHLR|nr:RNA helicase [Thermosporothrix sp. COM3]
MEESLFQQKVLWPMPLLQLNPRFEPGCTIDELVREGILHPSCQTIFRRDKTSENSQGLPLQLHRHQEDAIRVARTNESYVLTTGTGSGKSLAYIIPIVDYVLRQPRRPGIKAIVIYPMNALANSQLGELQKYLGDFPEVTFERYTGQESKEERRRIIANPPDILLTNYVMLELILTRPRERNLLRGANLRFLVLDELHTYRGRQGADVALLVRRVRERLTPPGEILQCVGTSATLASGDDYDEQRQEVARMASRLFGCPVRSQHVIGETLKRITAQVDETSGDFRQRLIERVHQYEETIPQTYEEFCADPLSIWLESTLGITRRQGRWVRNTPRRIAGDAQSATTLLQQITGLSEARCMQVIQQALLLGYEKIKDPTTGRPLFAFRLHQFISKGDTVYATVEPNELRHVTLQYQQFAPGDRNRVLLPLVFCRECGQEYYCVRWQDEETVVLREPQDMHHLQEDDEETSEKKERTGQPGFLYIVPEEDWTDDRERIDDMLPDEWKELRGGKLRLLPSYRKHRPKALRLRPDGTVTTGDDGTGCYFIRAPFRYCFKCEITYNSFRRSDFEKLAQLSSEGRSTATTILSLAAVRHLSAAKIQGVDIAFDPKMLSFTDNRQDASLQAGHFNDFIDMVILRSALYRAVMKAGEAGIEHDRLTQSVFEALQLPTEKYSAVENPKRITRDNVDKALRSVLGYRLYLDLRRGWRITTPNLEQCGLLEIKYLSLDDICNDDAPWKRNSRLAALSPKDRYAICQALLDHMRRELAIKVDFLESSYQEQIKQQSSQYLIAPWAIDENEHLISATRMFPCRRKPGDERSDIYVSGFSAFGVYLKGVLNTYSISLQRSELDELIQDLFAILAEEEMIRQVTEASGEGVPGYQLPAANMIWYAGDGVKPYYDPLRTPRMPEESKRGVNTFFLHFYRESAEDLRPLLGIRAAEHTAQVPSERRQEREKEFRENRLPILYCSPTMELGIDIADLNVVNMRNIPPTPANYAQRSGRAGRSGQPALVFSYCSTGNSHDQYFFQHPDDMVSGSVMPPRIDLANEDLLRSHVHAIWLEESSLEIDDSLKGVLEIEGNPPSLALREQVREALRDVNTRQRAEERARRIFRTLEENELTVLNAPWYAENWLSEELARIEERFDAACERWRSLLLAAIAQRDRQNEIAKDLSRSQKDRENAQTLRREAEVQINVLTANTDDVKERSEFSEFYSYRYFACEGFLPGYNFPRLPLSAYIPARHAKRDEYLSRPRFLAISEFAPRAIIYHEGSRYIINRSILGMREDRHSILTVAVKQCKECGYLHPLNDGRSYDVCSHCQAQLPAPTGSLFRLQNVSTRRRDRINSDEEERVRQGYDIRTGVRFLPRGDGLPGALTAIALNADEEPLVKLTYGQSALLWRINFGPLRRKDRRIKGFVLDTERGYWEKDDTSAGDPEDPMSGQKARVIPYVEDTRNCLLFEPQWSLSLSQMASLQAALKSAIQVRFQLEDNELAAEPLPDLQDRRLILFYEATEGGAGVLRQLIDTPQALAEVVHVALDLCHFKPETGEDLQHSPLALEDCEAACYHCLLTYSNQRDHRLLDRKSIKDVLWMLKGCTTHIDLSRLQPLPQQEEDPLLQEWLACLKAHGLRLPQKAIEPVGRCRARPDFFVDGGLIYIDGSDSVRAQRDIELAESVEDEGSLMLRFGERSQWDELFTSYADLFGRNA